MRRAPRLDRIIPVLVGGAMLAPGCQLASRSQIEECRRLSQTLRSENAQLKDRVLALQGQNRDLSERAVDDSHRLAQLEQVNSQLETSVQAYQDERSRLESAYRELRASLPGDPQPLTLRIGAGEPEPGENGQDATANPPHDAELRRTDGRARNGAGMGRTGRARDEPGPARGTWTPARSRDSGGPMPSPGKP
jgi:hypothetical protein